MPPNFIQLLRRFFYISIIMLFANGLFSQAPNFIFHNIGERQGLSNNFCYSILKDSRGMLWVATSNGLNRFDGTHFYNFRLGNDSTSFISSEIMDLCEDKEGNIWGGTSSGIFCYQPQKNVFVNYIPPTLDFARRIQNIICDKKGNIWATGEWNIMKLNKQTNKFEEVEPLTRNRDSLRYYSVRQNGLVEDPSGKGLWFATRSGLHYYNSAEQKFYSHKNMPGDSLFNDHSVAALSLAAGGYFWFFDNVTRDIKAFDPATHKILYRINMDKVIPNAFGQTLFEDKNNMLWVSTWNYKMAVIDYKKQVSTLIAYKNDNPLSIAGDIFWDVLEDEGNNIWIATAGGISKCNYSKNAYTIIPVTENVKEFKNSRLGAFTIDPTDNSWWLASEPSISVVHYYPQTGSYELYDFSKAKKNSIGQLPGPVYSVNFIDGQPYACTHTGVWQLDKKTRQATPFEKKFQGLPTQSYHYLIQNDNEIFFATKESYIKWNKLTDRTIAIKADVEVFPDGQKVNYSALLIDKSGRPWFVPAFGWLAFINENNKVEAKYYIKKKEKELAGYLTSVEEDKEGNLWMASTGVGLYKYDRHKGEMKLYDQGDGISRFINRAITDKEGRIWIAAANKFSVFNERTKSISHYNLPIHENTLNYSNTLLTDNDGTILATVNKDVVKFMPERLSLKPVIKEVWVSMIKISGKDKLIRDETKLNLEPDQNSLEFTFGSLISTEVFPYSFECRLDGFDEKWIAASASATALYNNLDPGKYVFRVKAIAKDRSWETPEKIITLIIRTPFYKASWFWLIIGGLLIGALIFFYRFRLFKQKQILTLETKAQQLEKEKTMVMYDNLKQQLNPHFLFNSLTSLSGLIEIDQQVAGNFLEQMSGIYRYILKNGDNETVFLKDEIEFAQLYINLQQTRFKKGLQVNINVPEEYMHYKIAPVTLQNLIENAIKHNIIDPASPLVIDVFTDGDYLVVKNNLQKKNVVETSNKKGLEQFASLYKYLSTLPVTIEETNSKFQIKIPLI